MNNQQPTSNLLKRETYKAIKRMEREQLSAYVSNIYITFKPDKKPPPRTRC